MHSVAEYDRIMSLGAARRRNELIKLSLKAAPKAAPAPAEKKAEAPKDADPDAEWYQRRQAQRSVWRRA
jgi:hypothetical protein